MDQKKIGQFLKALRKEKNITQEALAEELNVSGRTVSRWETGSNMPDISLLAELSAFYHVSISEIIAGERKGEEMNQEARNTAVSMAEYSKHELRAERKRIISVLLMASGVFIICSALAVFPSESSWGSIYATLGAILLTAGVYFRIKTVLQRRSLRLLSAAGCAAALFALFTVSDYIAVSEFHQVPRFSYVKSYGNDIVEHKTLFYTVVQKNPGAANESVEIVK